MFKSPEHTDNSSDIGKFSRANGYFTFKAISGTVHAHTAIIQDQPKTKQVITVLNVFICHRNLLVESPLRNCRKLCSKKKCVLVIQCYLTLQMEYNKRIESLMQENRTLRSELLLKAQKPSQRGRIKVIYLCLPSTI